MSQQHGSADLHAAAIHGQNAHAPPSDRRPADGSPHRLVLSCRHNVHMTNAMRRRTTKLPWCHADGSSRCPSPPAVTPQQGHCYRVRTQRRERADGGVADALRHGIVPRRQLHQQRPHLRLTPQGLPAEYTSSSCDLSHLLSA